VINLEYAYKKETATCYVFEAGERPDMETLYLKKRHVDEAGIDPKKGITVTVEGKA